MTTQDTNTGQQFTPQTEAERVMVDFIQMVDTLNKVNNSTVKALSKSAQGLLARLAALQAQTATVPARGAQGGRYVVVSDEFGGYYFILDTQTNCLIDRLENTFTIKMNAVAQADNLNAAAAQAVASGGGAS